MIQNGEEAPQELKMNKEPVLDSSLAKNLWKNLVAGYGLKVMEIRGANLSLQYR